MATLTRPPHAAHQRAETTPGVPAAPTHFPLFDGLRALAALSVLALHTTSAAHADVNVWYGHLTFDLRIGVPIFFAISGFLLYRPFVRARERSTRVNLGEYFKRRAVRIIPAYWLALTVLALTLGLPDVLSHRWWVYYFFGQVYSTSTESYGLGVAWTLCVEVSFYLLLPLLSGLITALARRRPRWPDWWADAAVLGVLSLLANVYRFWDLRSGSRHSATIYADFDWFVPGMAMAVISVRSGAHGIPRLIRRLADRPWLCWTGAVAIGLLQAIVINPRTYIDHPKQISHPITIVDHWAQAAIAALVILPAAFGSEREGLIRRTLALPVVAWVGMISYGIYLWHGPFISWLVRRGIFDLPGPPAVLITLATLAIACTVAAISYYALERPLMRRARSVGDRRLS